MFPIRLGSDAEFAAVRECLLACNYTEAAICGRFQVSSPAHLLGRESAEEPGEPKDTLGLLARLFLQGGFISARSDLPLPPLHALDLITKVRGQIAATVMLYPTRGLYIASDRRHPIDDSAELTDIVAAANVPNAALFLDYLPQGSCEAFLDLCAGAGAAALMAAQTQAAHAWAFDITARSTHFAEFNRRLNAIANATAAQGDLYAPAGRQTFDRIVAHPPYLPVYRPHYVFDSGGQDGEEVVKRMVEDLPRYLRPGGLFYALTMGTDRRRPFEERVREWLGASGGDFDIALVVRRTISPHSYTADAVVTQNGSVDDIARWRELLAEREVESLVYGLLFIQRRADNRAVFGIRRDAGPRTGPAECAWLLKWATASIHSETVLGMKPRARNNVSLEVEHRFIEGEWQPQAYRLASEYPFRASKKCETWTPHLLTIADGSRTVGELLDRLKSDEVIRGSVEPVEFARVVAALVSAGFLEVDEIKPAEDAESYAPR